MLFFELPTIRSDFSSYFFHFLFYFAFYHRMRPVYGDPERLPQMLKAVPLFSDALPEIGKRRQTKGVSVVS